MFFKLNKYLVIISILLSSFCQGEEAYLLTVAKNDNAKYAAGEITFEPSALFIENNIMVFSKKTGKSTASRVIPLAFWQNGSIMRATIVFELLDPKERYYLLKNSEKNFGQNNLIKLATSPIAKASCSLKKIE